MSGLPHADRRAGNGPPLVLLHYWGGSARTWAPVRALLPDRSSIAITARGWGRSMHLPGPFTLEQMAADVRAVVAEADLGEYVLVGHSMGGKVAQLVAAEGPADLIGLVLVAPAPAVPPPSVTPGYQESLSHAYDSAETVVAARDHVLTASPLAGDLAQQVLEDSLDVRDDARTEWPLRGIAQRIDDATARIDVPVLVVAGAEDRVEPPEVLSTHLLPHLARGRMSVIPGAGHLLPLEAPGLVAEQLASFRP